MANYPKITGREVREFTAKELRVAQNEPGKPTVLEGYAAVFDVLSQDLGGFVEKIQKGAFVSSIVSDDIRALMNHDPNIVLGRNKSGTLELAEDDYGLKIKITLPETQAANDLAVLIGRGDINQMSFAFETLEDDWHDEPGMITRTLIRVKLFDVSPVTYPAYLQTSIAARNAMAGMGINLEELGMSIVRAQEGRADQSDRVRIGAAEAALRSFGQNLSTLEGKQEDKVEERQVPLSTLMRLLYLAEAE
jgi:phage prohead protease, HK97 family